MTNPLVCLTKNCGGACVKIGLNKLHCGTQCASALDATCLTCPGCLSGAAANSGGPPAGGSNAMQQSAAFTSGPASNTRSCLLSQGVPPVCASGIC